MAQEGGRQGQAGRRDRRDRDRQGDHGIRGDRRGHARQDRGAGRHAGRGGQPAHRRAGGGGRGREGGGRGGREGGGPRSRLPAAPPRHRPPANGEQRAAPQQATTAAAHAVRRHRAARICPAQQARSAGAGTNRIFSSPLARRLAKEAGIDLGRIQGSGPHGRVIARDVEAAKSGKGLDGARGRRRARRGAARGAGAFRRQDPRAVRARLLRRSSRTTISAR